MNTRVNPRVFPLSLPLSDQIVLDSCKILGIWRSHTGVHEEPQVVIGAVECGLEEDLFPLAGIVRPFAPLLWGPWLHVVLVGTLIGTREVGCDLGLQAWKKPVLNLSLTGCVTLLNSASFSVQWG